jgi:hypothetical protein
VVSCLFQCDLPSILDPVTYCPRHCGVFVSHVSMATLNKKQPDKLPEGRIVWLHRKGQVVIPDRPHSNHVDVVCAFASAHAENAAVIRAFTTGVEVPPVTVSELESGVSVYSTSTFDEAAQRRGVHHILTLTLGEKKSEVIKILVKDLPITAMREMERSNFRVKIRVEIQVSSGVLIRVLCNASEQPVVLSSVEMAL